MTKFNGLTDQEAQLLLQKYGKNEIKDTHPVTALTILFRQIKSNSIIYLLLFAAIISLLVGKPVTSYAIFAVILMVISLGFIQEYRAERSINALKKLIMAVVLVL